MVEMSQCYTKEININKWKTKVGKHIWNESEIYP